MKSEVDRYWEQFLASVPPTAVRRRKYDWAFYFGSKRTAKAISALVLEGTKTATGCLKWEWDADNKRLMRHGDLSVVTDGSDHPVCIIEDTEIKVTPFDEVDERFVHDYGEGGTLEDWREGYWTMIVAECARSGRKPTRKAPIICERFRVLYKEPLE